MKRMARCMWDICHNVLVNEKVPFSLYKSKRSAMRVAVADVRGPMVKGLVSFSTATQTDDGLPHTLEHLVFMGSKRYPYKGILDVVANRCLASGTNAYTDQDHTAYSLTTVGSKGFLKVLPVYLDHLINPTLTDDQYLTEVHHINGEGRDAGVVYSEMQDGESEMDYLVHWRRKELVYPNYPEYKVETGGRLKNLRTTCSNEKVRAFHKEFYNLHNMLITVSGKIDHNELLGVVELFEDEVLKQTPSSFKRPFSRPVPPIEKKVISKVLCPSDDSSQGTVQISWFGPNAADVYKVNALEVLFRYFTDTAVAPFQRDFVLCDEPLCSSVSLYMIEQQTCEIILNFGGVNTEKIDGISVKAVDKTLDEHRKPENFDMERMKFMIDRSMKRLIAKMETNANSVVQDALVGHQLFGSDEEKDKLTKRLNTLSILNELKQQPAQFWSNLTNEYFKGNYVNVIGLPDVALVEKIAAEEEARIEKQQKDLGEEGLKKCGDRMAEAIKNNTSNKPSEELLDSFMVYDLEKFDTFDISTNSNINTNVPKKRRTFIDELPFPSILHDAPTKFIDMTLIVDTTTIPLELRHFMMLWFELMFESPAYINEKLHNYEEVAVLATRDLISRRISTGVSNFYDHFVSLRLKVDAPSYKNLAIWTKILLRDIYFDPARIAITSKKLATQAVEMKRDGSYVASVLMHNTISKSDANTKFYNVIALEKFHNQISKAVDKNGEEIVAKLKELRDAFLKCSMNVHFACSIEEVNTVEANSKEWDFISNRDRSPSKETIFTSKPGTNIEWLQAGTTKIAGVAATESAFIIQKAHFNQGYDGADFVEVLLLAQYLSQCEGPLWNSVRGRGLAYGANIYPVPDQGSIVLSLYRCSQAVEAYKATKDLILGILDKKKLEPALFEAAKRSLVCELAASYENVKSAYHTSLLSTIRDIPHDYIITLCQRIWEANEDHVVEKGSPYLRNLFDDSKCVRAITAHPSKIEELKQAFKNSEIIKIENIQIPPLPFKNIPMENGLSDSSEDEQMK